MSSSSAVKLSSDATVRVCLHGSIERMGVETTHDNHMSLYRQLGDSLRVRCQVDARAKKELANI